MTPTYDVDYFIAKFEATKPEDWAVGFLNIGGRKCALGQCGTDQSEYGYEFTEEGLALVQILSALKAGAVGYDWSVVSDINDQCNRSFQQAGPRARILAALNEIKSKGAK